MKIPKIVSRPLARGVQSRLAGDCLGDSAAQPPTQLQRPTAARALGAWSRSLYPTYITVLAASCEGVTKHRQRSLIPA